MDARTGLPTVVARRSGGNVPGNASMTRRAIRANQRLVIPAIAALIATNYKGQDRIKAFAIIGGVSGVAAAVGPLIGGYVTTYLSWRYVF